MTLRVDATPDQMAGLQAATDKHNVDAKAADTDPKPDISVHVDITPEAYWDKVYGDVKDFDPRSEQEVFDQACLSYQSQFDVGIGKSGVASLVVAKADTEAKALAAQSAEELKARYQSEQAAAAAESAKIIAAQEESGVAEVKLR